MHYLRSESDSSLLTCDPHSFPPPTSIYGSELPLEVEIGCGKGKFLIARAVEHPEMNFLGIDVIWKWMKFGVRRSDKREIDNIRFVRADAKEVIAYGLPPASVSIFHIYFPDPWPKRRHRKRRLVTADFLRLLHSRLTDHGVIELATDHHEYYTFVQAAVEQSGVEWAGVSETTDERLFEADTKTNYEIKYEHAGRTIYYMELEK